MMDHNIEEIDHFYTRPTLDLYICDRYWNFLTKGMSNEEIEDFKKVKSQLEHYNKIYSLMEYGNTISATMTILETRIATNNPSIPMTIYRQSPANKVEKVVAEMD